LGIRPATVLNWCEKRGVSSQYSRPRIHTDEEILKIIKKHKVVRSRDIAEKLNYSTPLQAYRRLRSLVTKGKLKVKRIANPRRSPVKKYYYGYINCDLYYIEEADFEKWALSRAKGLPKYLKKSYAHFLKSIGINIPIKEQTKKYVSLPEELYSEIKEKAQAEKISIEEYIIKRVRG